MADNRQRCQQFLETPADRRYIFGINEYADSIADQLEFAGFIDDFREERNYRDKPVLKTGEVPKDAFVVSSLVGRPFTAKRILQNAGLQHLDYFSFHYFSGKQLAPVRFWSDFRPEFQEHRQAYAAIGEKLADQQSRELFEQILQFRLTADLNLISSFRENQRNQYFESFLALGPGDSFADVGGFDGMTSLEFILRCPDYRCVYLFEPEAGNMKKARRNLSGFRDIHFIQKGLSDQAATLSFAASGSTSQVSASGTQEIEVDRLDDLLEDDELSFIKMDIEGLEIAALSGAKALIKRCHPRLAISVYHHPQDLRTIPELVLGIRPDYRLYLRHYTEGVVETVMFFMPDPAP